MLVISIISFSQDIFYSLGGKYHNFWAGLNFLSASAKFHFHSICLKLYHSEKGGFWKHRGKGRKYWFPAFSVYLTMFSTLSRTKFIIWATLTLYLICQFWDLPIQQQIKICCQKCSQMRIQFSDLVENIEQFLFFIQCFQKLSVVDASKWVSMK